MEIMVFMGMILILILAVVAAVVGSMASIFGAVVAEEEDE